MNTTTAFTRQEYLAQNCTHREYYAQFVNSAITDRVINAFGAERICNSEDPHFNDIPLARWDVLLIPVPAWINKKMRELGDYPTLAGCVCILKEAANQIREGKEL